MAKRVELDPNSMKGLFKRTEPEPDAADKEPVPAAQDAVQKTVVPDKQARETELPPATSPQPKRQGRKSASRSKPDSSMKTYDLVRLMAVGGKWVYLTQITDPEPILVLLHEFKEDFAGKFATQASESPLGTLGFIALSDFILPLTAGDAFRWFATRLCHSGWKPFAAEQSSPDIPAHQYRDAIYFRLDHHQTSRKS
ncbi:MAG: hypothetical protein JXA97_13485 [Anaerolineales bacterium]|nr:hypothetical protein [Anaerolineales bacterium]